MFSSVPGWVLVRTLKFDDADVAVAATTATITLDKFKAAGLMKRKLYMEDCLVHERVQCAGNAGTLVLDVGKSGSTEIYAKDVSLKSASGTDTLGSGTTSVKPAILESQGLPIVLTLTSSSGNLSTLSAGVVDIYIRVSPAPVLN